MNQVKAFLSAWADAERNGDLDFLEASLTDDFVGVGPLGFDLPKAAWVARHRGGDLRYQSYQLSDLTVRSYGPVVIAIARQEAVGTFQDHPLPEVLRATLVLVGEGGAWRLAGVHLSFVAGTKGGPPLPGPSAPASLSADG